MSSNSNHDQNDASASSPDHPLCDPYAGDHPVKIFTRPLCGYCVMAKRLLKSRGIAYEELDTQGHPEVRAWLVEVTRQRTVPQVFIHGSSIGGYTELTALDRAGELTRLTRLTQS